MSENNNEDSLRRLSRSTPPPASDAARQRALAAAMEAFDTAQKKNASAPQGGSIRDRLRSIGQNLRGNWIMDTRISLGLGTAAVALLLLPLGYQLMTSTAITPPPAVVDPAPAELHVEQPVEPLVRQEADEQRAISEEPVIEPALESPPTTAAAPLVAGAAPKESEFADFDSGLMEKEDSLSRTTRLRPQVMAGAPAVAVGEAMPLPAPEMSIAPTQPSGDEFTAFEESPRKLVAEEPVSTFSIDVDTASYSYVRRTLTEGWLPEPDAVRIEELINYFDYDYAGPETADTPFKPTVAIYPAPWNPKTQLLQIGIKGYEPPVTEDKASNLVFLLDTSGSMDEPDKLPLLKRAFALLVNQLGANDTISIVAYAGSAGVVLEPTSATDKAKILGALDNLAAGGSTAGAEGITLAYRLAEQAKVEGGINRVILATDGDFNVGINDPDALEDFIKAKRDGGIFLSVLGFGQGNLGDDTMQALAQNGNGNAAYIDSFKEAQKVLVEQIGGTLETIAKDVKIQIEFNPALVAEYRLIGYETRALNREDFNNDKVDAGEIGAGHTVTALYEIVPPGSGAELVDPLRFQQPGTPTSAVLPSDDIAFLKLRYKLPEGDTSTLMELPIGQDLIVDDIAQASDDARWAASVAAFGQLLKGSDYGGTITWDDIRTLAQGARGTDALGYRAEFMQLIDMAEALQ